MPAFKPIERMSENVADPSSRLQRAVLILAAIGFCFIIASRGLAQPATPNPTYSFNTGTGSDQIGIGGSPADANVAASSTHVCLTARGAFACYTKSGTLVAPGLGFDARPYTAKDFFEKSGFTFDPLVSTNNTAKDGRIVFDRTRKRFFAAFQTREPHPRLLIAVSKTQDPRDGWWTYADDVEGSDVNGQDYMRIGVNGTHFLVANEMAKCTGTYPANWNCAYVGTRHFLYTADDLAAGTPYTRTQWSDPGANGAAPCVHDSYTTDAFWVHRDDATHASVWAVRNGQVTSHQVTIQTSSGPVNGPIPGGDFVDYGNIGQHPQNAHYRDGRIVFVSNVGHTWSGQSTANNAVHLVRLNVSAYFDRIPSVTVEYDKIFGRASADDPARAIFDYGWPAVAANGSGDIVVGSVRNNSATYPELRGSVWFAGESDISSSVSLQTSSSSPALCCPAINPPPYLSEFHMAGASADPSTPAVYLAQQYGSTVPNWRIHVAKMLGSVMPDLLAPQVQAPAFIKPGASSSVDVTVMNQGDGPMPASLGRLYLSTDNVIDLLGPDVEEDPTLATFAVPALAPDSVVTLTVPFTISAAQALGNYFVGVVLDLANAASEYSESNNLNPFPYGYNHGNAPMTVTDLLQLKITQALQYIIISWPETASRYQLQQSTTLDDRSWTRVSEAPMVTNRENQVTIRVQPGQTFYRLRAQ